LVSSCMTENQVEIIHLAPFEEAIGTLHELNEVNGTMIARLGKVVLALPPELGPNLRPLLGHRIDMLKTDIPGKVYLIREIVARTM
jgi:hypothetical protein